MASRFNHKNGALYKVCDSQLDEYDVDCIKRDEFLSDRAIHFFINYFYSKFAQDLKKTIEILSPEVVQLVKMVDENESKEILAPLKLADKNLIILPVNDNVSPLSGGGTHWSLLVYCRYNNTFYHYDSLSNANNEHAAIVAKKVTEVLEVNQLPDYSCGYCNQQQNSIDCGLYVIQYAKKILEIINDNPFIANGLLNTLIVNEELSRKNLLKILHSFSETHQENREES